VYVYKATLKELLSVFKWDTFLHYYHIVGSDWYTYTRPCQARLCKSICNAGTFIEFYVNSYITKHFIIDDL